MNQLSHLSSHLIYIHLEFNSWSTLPLLSPLTLWRHPPKGVLSMTFEWCLCYIVQWEGQLGTHVTFVLKAQKQHKNKWHYCWTSLTKCKSLFLLSMTTLRPFSWSCNWQTWWWKTTASSRATPQNSQGITTSPSRGLLGGLSEDRQTDCGAESMFEAIVSELVSDTPEVLLFIPSALGGDAGCLLKDAKAEAGLQPVWNTQTKQWIKYQGNTFPTMTKLLSYEHLLIAPLKTSSKCEGMAGTWRNTYLWSEWGWMTTKRQ